MKPQPLEIDGISAGFETLRSYSGLQESRAWVMHPGDRTELGEIFRHAREQGRRITFRAGGRSFDGQSLGDDVVVSMSRFNEVSVSDDTVTVGAGATWGQILAVLQEHGRVPAVVVTTHLASAGGTMSGNCLSRFSAAYGKEGTCVRSFELMTPDETVHVCSRPAGPPATLEDELFLGTIGGLGYLGAVLSITYETLPAPKVAPTVVQTEVGHIRGLENHAERYVDLVYDTTAQRSTPLDETLPDAVYSAVSVAVDGETRALVFRSTLRGAATGKPLLIYRPEHWLRVPVELLFRFRAFNRLIWWLNVEVLHRRRKCYVNALGDFTFFMDGNGRAKRTAAALRVDLKTLQQTFVIPSVFTSPEGLARTKTRLASWLRTAAQVFEAHGIAPTFQDVLWLPHDHAFPLSTTATSGGFAVSYAFDSSLGRRVEAAERALRRLSTLVRDYGGRVYLVKNVYADRSDLRAMYGDGIRRFRALKDRVDPSGTLRNAFFDEKF